MRVKCGLIQHKFKVFENTAPRAMFGLKVEGKRGWYRKIHNEELHKL
jgi:hypothetical protein